MEVMGIDIGGTGIKAAIVDSVTGELLTERERVETPKPATPEAVMKSILQLLRHFKWKGPVGCGFPGVIRNGTIFTAANMDAGFIGFDLATAIRSRSDVKWVSVLNDADAAGYCEMRMGAGREVQGTVIMITVGTGIGTSMFYRGQLIPNTEIGHIEFKGKDAELQLSDSARKKKDIPRKKWAVEFHAYLHYLENLFWPELFIIGGGGAKKPEKFEGILNPRTKVAYASLRNQAGIVGAGLAASERLILR